MFSCCDIWTSCTGYSYPTTPYPTLPYPALDARIEALDAELQQATHDQALAGVAAEDELKEAHATLLALAEEIPSIGAAAADSENKVAQVCADLQAMDTAKQNLTTAIQTLHRLQMFMTSVHRLEECAEARQYPDAATLLAATQALQQHFSEYADVPQIAALCARVSALCKKLRGSVLEDFEVLSEEAIALAASADLGAADDMDDDDALYAPSGPTPAASSLDALSGACAVVDALGSDVRDFLVGALVRKALRQYTPTFRGEDGMQLPAVERRYAWIRRVSRDLGEQLERVLPKGWLFQCRLNRAFADLVRADVSSMLSGYDPPDSAPAEAMVRALNKTLGWEREAQRAHEANVAALASELGIQLTDTQPVDEYDESAPLINADGEVVPASSAEGIRLRHKRRAEWNARKEAAAAESKQSEATRAWLDRLRLGKDRHAPAEEGEEASSGGHAAAMPDTTAWSISGVISEVFTPYLGAYIALERATLSGVVAETGAEATAVSSELDLADARNSTLRSAPRLFLQIKNAVNRCAQLGTGQVMFDLYRAINGVLDEFAAALEGALPQPVDAAASAAKRSGFGVLGGGTSAVAVFGADTFELDCDAEGLHALQVCGRVQVTAEYAAETLPGLAETLKHRCDEAFAPHVSFDSVVDRLFALGTNAVVRAALLGASLLDNSMLGIVKTDWTMETLAADASPWTQALSENLVVMFPLARSLFGGGAWRQFCDKFARAVIRRLVAAVRAVRRIRETGAAQLQLDMRIVQTALDQAPQQPSELEAASGISAEDLPAPSRVYTKVIDSEFSKLGSMLKILGTPLGTMVGTVEMLWPGITAAQLVPLMNARGFKRTEQQEVLRGLGLDAGAAAGDSGMSFRFGGRKSMAATQ